MEEKRTKSSLVTLLKEHGVHTFAGTKIEDLTFEELSSLQSQQVKEDKSSKRDPMTGLSGMSRGELNKILNWLQPGEKAEDLKNAGLVMLQIRQQLHNLTPSEIKFGSHKDKTFSQFLEPQMQSYRKWARDNCNEESNQMLKQLTMFISLHFGWIQHQASVKMKEEPKLKTEVPYPDDSWVYEDVLQTPVKNEHQQMPFPPRSTASASAAGNSLQPPVYDGTSSFEQYEVVMQSWLQKVKKLGQSQMSDASKRAVPTDDNR